MLIWKTALSLNWRTSLVSPASAPVAAANVGRLVLTGATGFIGSTVLTALVNAGLLERIACVVRARDRGHAVARLREAALRAGLTPYWASRLTDANVIVGALGDVWHGADASRLAGATHVIHCAGHASPADGAHLRADIADAVRFAERFARAPRLQRFVYVGTAYAHAGRGGIVQEEAERAGNDVVPRAGDGLPGAVLAADYLHAKAETEQRLRALGLPLVVVRPSHVVGHTVLGTRPAPNSFWMFRLAHAARRFTARPMTRIDIVSVDDVARATMLLAVKPTLAHDVYHVSAGDEAPQVAQIVRAMDEAAGMTGAPRYAACAPAELPLVVRDVLGRPDPALERVIGRALQRCGEFATVDRVFDNRRVRDEIDFEPLPFIDYVEECMRTSRGVAVTELMRGAIH
ncbi:MULTISPECIES: SDR family oxidoreductase [Burkholderia]|uniref:SDR family oxidoreductase n=1 Tax=Burkholderia TaxID=32008 RepID=UPI000679C335|nr:MULTISPECIES: SDR family oxidoreductase [Burkholderia]KWU23991.1 epimerase [Burkholderia cenocepacia]OXI71039.1 epimerase [Burkholderia sp. AU31280]QRR15296.1 NAD-dependent epimerase/dehydratase family protein [Burkholderia sp. MS389]RQV67787.1 NAD-dependent epimerase/dehydratase family protein [Burkholderia cenocepacia]CAG2348317.1 epimerase [Burkholderia cenocepacia]